MMKSLRIVAGLCALGLIAGSPALATGHLKQDKVLWNPNGKADETGDPSGVTRAYRPDGSGKYQLYCRDFDNALVIDAAGNIMMDENGEPMLNNLDNPMRKAYERSVQKRIALKAKIRKMGEDYDKAVERNVRTGELVSSILNDQDEHALMSDHNKALVVELASFLKLDEATTKTLTGYKKEDQLKTALISLRQQTLDMREEQHRLAIEKVEAWLKSIDKDKKYAGAVFNARNIEELQCDGLTLNAAAKIGDDEKHGSRVEIINGQVDMEGLQVKRMMMNFWHDRYESDEKMTMWMFQVPHDDMPADMSERTVEIAKLASTRNVLAEVDYGSNEQIAIKKWADRDASLVKNASDGTPRGTALIEGFWETKGPNTKDKGSEHKHEGEWVNPKLFGMQEVSFTNFVTYGRAKIDDKNVDEIGRLTTPEDYEGRNADPENPDYRGSLWVSVASGHSKKPWAKFGERNETFFNVSYDLRGGKYAGRDFVYYNPEIEEDGTIDGITYGFFGKWNPSTPTQESK